MKDLDDTNKTILRLLQENGRITNTELSERVGLSPASILERVKKLEKQGIIQGYVAILNREKLDKATMAYVAISLTSHHPKAVTTFRERISIMGEVLECHHIAGDDDYLLKVVTQDMRSYERFLGELSTLETVGRFRTTFVMSTLKNKTQINLD